MKTNPKSHYTTQIKGEVSLMVLELMKVHRNVITKDDVLILLKFHFIIMKSIEIFLGIKLNFSKSFLKWIKHDVHVFSYYLKIGHIDGLIESMIKWCPMRVIDGFSGGGKIFLKKEKKLISIVALNHVESFLIFYHQIFPFSWHWMFLKNLFHLLSFSTC